MNIQQAYSDPTLGPVLKGLSMSQALCLGGFIKDLTKLQKKGVTEIPAEQLKAIAESNFGMDMSKYNWEDITGISDFVCDWLNLPKEQSLAIANTIKIIFE